MVLNQLDRINYYNVLAMLVSACVAIFIPFELTLLSYAILGPAHYLTEMSWLNDRRFFTVKKYDYLLIASVIVIALVIKLPSANLVFYAFGLSFLLLILKDNLHRLLAGIILVFLDYFLLANNLLRTFFGLYMVTLVHVYLFTGAFLLYGSLKAKSMSGYIAFMVFISCPVLVCVLFSNWNGIPAEWAINNFKFFLRIITTTLRNQNIDIYTNKSGILLARIIAFAYTYHYLNWFSKIRIIEWHRVPVSRAIIIGLIWIASVALYYYNYRLGFKWLLLLSFLHVILEFPLNQRTFVGIANELGKGLMRLRHRQH